MTDEKYEKEDMDGIEKIMATLSSIFDAFKIALIDGRPFIVTGVVMNDDGLFSPLNLANGEEGMIAIEGK